MAHNQLYLASVIACVLLTVTYVEPVQTVNGRVKISTGTASGCSDTRNFLINQLLPVYQEFGKYLDLEFVPWGRTVRNEDGNLICQFGVNDCWANRLHRCVLNILKNDQAAQLHYMVCEFRDYVAFLQGTYQCVQSVGLNLVEVDYCMSTTGDLLEDTAQAAASEPMSLINFVPSIVLNDVIDVGTHTEARTNLRGLVCNALAEDATVNDINAADC